MALIIGLKISLTAMSRALKYVAPVLSTTRSDSTAVTADSTVYTMDRTL